jgi:hypothetical protein
MGKKISRCQVLPTLRRGTYTSKKNVDTINLKTPNIPAKIA